MPRILFIAAHRPDRSPSQRYRFEQYFEYLRKNGFECELSYLIDEKSDQLFYNPGHLFSKFLLLLRSHRIRKADVKRYNEFDIVFVQREAIMVGTTKYERAIKRSKAKFVFDFDDSIWLMDTSEANKKWEWLKNPKKTEENISMADLVFAGNSYLKDYALQFNQKVVVIPTTVDTDKFVPNFSKRNKNKIVIGWSGSITTIKHFKTAESFLLKLKEKFGDRIEFKVMGDETYFHETLNIKGIRWTSESEREILNSFDIGIMPLPDDKWAKGKCGLKGLTYMALEIPTVMSPVGVNAEIIKDGINGFLANKDEEWIQKISMLIENPDLRVKIGNAARQTVCDNYSVFSQQEKYLNLFRKLL